VSFEVGYGDVFGFPGPNGAGRTTTVKTLGTLIAPPRAQITAADNNRSGSSKKGQNMAATLQLVRETGSLMELRRGPFHVLLDGNDVGSIDRHQTIEVPVEPGHHTLQVKAGRYTSGRRPFDTADGEIVNFRCNGAVIWPVYLASIVKPDLALTLKHE
jgi:energy-coupling factor transporter ATP-binding protein EcfA2